MIEHLFSLYPGNYTMQDFMYAFHLENSQFVLTLVIAVLTFSFGYMEYIYNFQLVRREKSAPLCQHLLRRTQYTCP